MPPSFTFATSHAESARRRAARSGPTKPTASCETRQRSLEEIDNDYKLVGCIGQSSGTFGNRLLLATKKKSSRKCALKLIKVDNDDEATMQSLVAELNRVVTMSNASHQNIVNVEECFFGSGFVCIATSFSHFGTLADQIDRKKKATPFEPYAERRIAWYALQISDALVHAHRCGVMHRNVCSSNVLVDSLGQLRLGNFSMMLEKAGRADDCMCNDEVYAPPELLDSRQGSVNEEKVDAFGLGCILFELISCSRLKDLSDSSSDECLAEFITESGLRAALALPCITLPWLPAPPCDSMAPYIGYSHSLKILLAHLIEPLPTRRWSPSSSSVYLGSDRCNQSPSVSAFLSAAQSFTPGAAVTVDNLQPGMYVQRGRDWQYGDADGGRGCIGVVVKVHGAEGTYAAFPKTDGPIRCRIGVGNAFDLQVAPPLGDNMVYFGGPSKWSGIVWTRSIGSKDSIGSSFCGGDMVIVAKEHDKMFVAPTERVIVPTLPPPNINACKTLKGDVSVPMQSITSYLAGYSAAAADGMAKGATQTDTTAKRKTASVSSKQKDKSKTKECVVCMEKPVRRIMLPCGHPCLCDDCSKHSVLRRLKRKCPECRQWISQTAVIYGRVVDD